MKKSWADEVESEEQEQKQNQKSNHGVKPKVNPFGSARPREVVLEEKGIDWRKLDQHVNANHSNLRNDENMKPTFLMQGQIVFADPDVPPLKYVPRNYFSLMERIRKGRKDLNPEINTQYSDTQRRMRSSGRTAKF